MFERVVGINIIIVGWVTSFLLRRVVFDRVGWLRRAVGTFLHCISILKFTICLE